MHEPTGYFSVKSIGMSTRLGRKPQSLLNAARHNLREIQAEQGANGHIDAKRTSQNRVMRGPPTAQLVMESANKLFEAAGVDTTALRKDYCHAIELLFSLPVGCGVDDTAFFEHCLAWAEKLYQLPVLLAIAHYDEGAKHMHLLMLPLAQGRYVGATPVNISTTKRMRESFFELVGGPFGLKRANARLYGPVKAWGVQAVLSKVAADGLPACAGMLWPILKAAIERDPLPAMQALQIDTCDIRPDANTEYIKRPIDIADADKIPIGFSSAAELKQNLSSVGIADPGAAPHQRQTESTSANSEPSASSRIDLSSVKARSKHVEARDEEEGITRDREGFCQVPEAWSDL